MWSCKRDVPLYQQKETNWFILVFCCVLFRPSKEHSRLPTSRSEPNTLQHGNRLKVPQQKLVTVDVGNAQEPGEEPRSCVSSPGDTRRSRESLATSDRSDNSLRHSRENLQHSGSYEKPTSLEAVLQLLQEQQLVQQLGQQKFTKAKKAQNAWKRTAVAAREAVKGSRPDSPDGEYERHEAARRQDSGATERHRSESFSQRSLKDFEATPKQSPVEIIEKLSGEENLRALKKETLLKKRRNSLNLEKDELEKKIVKGQEKKSTVKKLLGKEEVENKEDISSAEKRLGNVHQELENIQKDINANRRQQAEVLENLNNLKTKTVRKYSSASEPNHARVEEKRAAFRSSPSESASSHGSAEERPGRESDFLPRTPDSSRNKSAVNSLAALEIELRKISPLPRRAPEITKKRLSFSSEGSPDDASLMGSPVPTKKPEPRLRESVSALASSTAGTPGVKVPVSETLLDSTQLRRKRFSASARVSFHQLSVEIPTDDESRLEETGLTQRKTSAEMSLDTETKNEEHRTSLVNALSQIKVMALRCSTLMELLMGGNSTIAVFIETS